MKPRTLTEIFKNNLTEAETAVWVVHGLLVEPLAKKDSNFPVLRAIQNRNEKILQDLKLSIEDLEKLKEVSDEKGN